jgi:hypothetical protein
VAQKAKYVKKGVVNGLSDAEASSNIWVPSLRMFNISICAPNSTKVAVPVFGETPTFCK